MIKFLHLSDSHFHGIANNDALTDRLSYIRQNYPEHRIILTGDITDDGTPEQYAKAFDNLYPFKDRLYLCPGNHDYGPIGSIYLPEAAQRFEGFALAFGKDGFINDIPVIYSPENVLIIMLSSNLQTMNPFDFACGEIGNYQLTKLDSLVSSKGMLNQNNDIVTNENFIKIVCLHHHPFIHSDPTMELLDAKEFLRTIYGKVDILMFGHKHEHAIWYNKCGCKYIMAAGAMFQEDYVTEITIDGKEISIRKGNIIGI